MGEEAARKASLEKEKEMEALRRRGYVEERSMKLNGKDVKVTVTIKTKKDRHDKFLSVLVLDIKSKKEKKMTVKSERFTAFLIEKGFAPVATEDSKAAEVVFNSLQMFQSRAKGITVLVIKGMPSDGGTRPNAEVQQTPKKSVVAAPYVDTPTIERPSFVPPLQIEIIRKRLGYT